MIWNIVFLICFFIDKFDVNMAISPFYVPSSLGLRKLPRQMKQQACFKESEKALVFVNTNSILTEGGIFVGLHGLQGNRNLSTATCHAALFALMDSIVMSARLLFIKGINKGGTQLLSLLYLLYTIIVVCLQSQI